MSNLCLVAFLNSGFGTTLAAGATALLSLSFVFATTAQEVLGSCIFLFVKVGASNSLFSIFVVPN